MFVLMMIIAGMAVALAIYFLLAAIFPDEPNLDRYTVEDLGVILSALVFVFCGPVLVLKLWNADEGGRKFVNAANLDLIAKGVIASTWSGILGFAIMQSAYLILVPKTWPI